MARQTWARAALLAVGFAVAALGMPGELQASDDSLRCQNRIIMLGNSMYDVQALCGPPDFTDRRVQQRTAVRPNRFCPAGARCPGGILETVEVTIDEWTYDFGRNRFVHYLLFEDGLLVSVRQGSYGHKVY
jgi:hypothetical protein